MSDAKTAPAPWFHDPNILWACMTTKPGGRGGVVATVDAADRDIASATASRIVRCVNAHDALVAACRKAMLACQDNLAMAAYKNEPVLGDAYWACNAALAKAEGGAA